VTSKIGLIDMSIADRLRKAMQDAGMSGGELSRNCF
jgi:hypothetical protein